MKKKIAIVAGGYSGEAEVSFKSAQMILNHIDRNQYEPYYVEMAREKWVLKLEDKEFPIDKNDFSVTLAEEKLKFDGVFIIIHGSPGENGILQGYFQIIGMPHTTGSVWNMSTTFNKSACNNFLRSFGYSVANNLRFGKEDVYSSSEIVATLGLPIFVKPNNGGSSIATSKVELKEGLHEAIDLALSADDQVILEQFIQGTEVTCGVIVVDGKITPLPVTEIVAHNSFFDYQAKYQGASEEITPARIMESEKILVQKISGELYSLLNCKGMIRADFILKGDEAYIIEVNTVPGFSEQSIIPQQAAAIGMSKTELISHVLQSTVK